MISDPAEKAAIERAMYLAAQREAAGVSPLPVVAPVPAEPRETDVPLYSSPRISGAELRALQVELRASLPRRRVR